MEMHNKMHNMAINDVQMQYVSVVSINDCQIFQPKDIGTEEIKFDTIHDDDCAVKLVFP